MTQITSETNDVLKQLGDISSPQNMEPRMRQAGYRLPDGLEFLVPALAPGVAPTVSVTSTVSPVGGNR
jgi:hypothetical protein